VLFALELVGAVAVADGDREGIDAGLRSRTDGFLGMGVVAAGGVTAALFALIELGARPGGRVRLRPRQSVLVGVIDHRLQISTFFSNGSWLASIMTW
jgi:hypothetical protein